MRIVREPIGGTGYHKSIKIASENQSQSNHSEA
jgi:hypothetical protein